MSSTDTQTLVRMQDETLYFLNQIKNSQSVHIGENQVLTRLYTGQKMFVDARDISMSPALMMEGQWDPEVTALITGLLKPTDCFVDVGAAMGYFGILAGTIISAESGGSIHMIEANPQLVPLIFKSINVTGLLGTAAVANLAISDEPGEVQLQVVKDLMGSSSLIDLDSQFRSPDAGSAGIGVEIAEQVTVPSTTLDAYAQKESLAKIDLIKLGVDGAEELAYRGMGQVIQGNRGHLQMLMDFTPHRYDDPVDFYETIKGDFKYVYGLDRTAGLPVEVLSYADLAAMSGTGSVMLLVTNQEESNI